MRGLPVRSMWVVEGGGETLKCFRARPITLPASNTHEKHATQNHLLSGMLFMHGVFSVKAGSSVWSANVEGVFAVAVALWGHLRHRAGGEGPGHRVQPHVPQGQRQEVGDAQVLHGTPHGAAHGGAGKDHRHGLERRDRSHTSDQVRSPDSNGSTHTISP